MASFLSAFAEVLIYEGNYSNDPDDPGGETRYGISKRAFPDEDIANLTLDRAHDIYMEDYWKPLRCGNIGSQLIANELFEQGVNMGTGTAVMVLQESLNVLGAKLEVDGAIGPQTLEAVNTYRHTDALLKVMQCLQFDYYKKLIERKPKMKKFMRGWLRRIEL